jgi:uncharacterized protein (TIGR02996 family)
MIEVRLIDVAHGPRVVELSLDGLMLSRRYGRLEASLAHEQHEFSSAEAAEEALGKAIETLRRAGYTFAGEHELLLAAIERESERIDHYLVYADWLLEHRNPHGDLIHLMIAASGKTPDASVIDAVARLVLEHRHEFQPWSWRHLKLEWRWGFVYGVEFESGTNAPQLAVGERRTLIDADTDRRPPLYSRRWQPGAYGPDTWETHAATVLGLRLQTLRRHPCGRALRRLRCHASEFEVQFDGSELSLVRLR